MNLTWELYRREDRKWGVMLPDGSFDGMVGSLANGNADMIVTSLTASEIRQRVVDFGVCIQTLVSA